VKVEAPWLRPHFGALLVWLGAWTLLGHPAIARTGALAGAGFAVGILWGLRTVAKRRAVVARIAEIVGRETQTSVTAPGFITAGRWQGMTPRRLEIRYGPRFDDTDDQARARVEVAVTRKAVGLHVPLVADWQPSRDLVTFREPRPGDPDPRKPEPPVERDSGRAVLTERLDAAIRGFIRTGDPKIQVADWDDVGPRTVRIAYPSTFRDDAPETRFGLQEVINAKAPGRWRLDWETDADRVVAARRPAMPAKIDHHVPADLSDTWRLPFATDEDGAEVAWDLRVAPHCLVAGETGGGKTVALRALITEAALRGFEIRILDPKRVEMMGLRGWPNVAEVATDTEDMIDLMERMHEKMDSRYAEVESRRVAKDSHRPVLLVVDEAHEWIERSNAWWKANREKGQTGTVHPVVEQWRSIARLGRTARVHLLVGIQRPDASIFGGAARDNYGARVALGALSQDGAKMMFQDSSVGRDVPADAKGRATADVGSGPREVQVWWTPDPESGPDPLLDALRPAAVVAR
jgi:hypothetical protein